MLHHLLQAVFEKVTGTPYYTDRCASREFGPAPAKTHAAYLSTLTDEASLVEWEAIKRGSRQPQPVRTTWPALDGQVRIGATAR